MPRSVKIVLQKADRKAEIASDKRELGLALCLLSGWGVLLKLGQVCVHPPLLTTLDS